ncbi:hypothetical protein [Burkholderia gladioli]|uniref:hypothetical protein n=1 Tax=Burkholderia gladioli TaxID=28095 RepID=UPI0016400780|nr:hypothetical protein [Burkholderia gladioli]
MQDHQETGSQAAPRQADPGPGTANPESVARRKAIAGLGFFGAAMAALVGNRAWGHESVQGSFGNEALALPPGPAHAEMDEEERAIKIARAMQAGPSQITRDATVAEMDMHGNMSRILRQGSNGWVCTPGNENRIGDPPMCVDRVGMQWFKDIHDRKPRPSITTPGLCYMLCGATQHSNSDALDTTSPAIPIGPHWMVLWPFDAAHCGLPTDVRDAGAWIMFAGTPYAYLHVCGSPWVGNSYTPGDRAVWTMRYAKSND